MMRRWIAILTLVTGILRCQTVAVTVLATTDLHGYIYPVDYVTNRPAALGLAKMGALIQAARAENPNSLLIDCGDTIQGSPLESVYQTFVRTGADPLGHKPAAPMPHDPPMLHDPPMPYDPMMRAMNLLGYDLMVVGNHEFNYGLKNFERARSEARFPWISANIGGGAPFPAFLVKTVGGVKVAVIGVTTPVVPTWEKPGNLGTYRFLNPVDAVKKAIVELHQHEHPDLILVAAHSGLGRNLKTGDPDEPEENVVYEMALKVRELDAIVFGHTHSQLAGVSLGKVLLAQPKNWGVSLARLDFQMERKSAGGWRVASKTSRLIPATEQTVAVPGILAMARPYQDATERYLQTPVASSERALEATRGREEDTAIVDAVQEAQLYYAKADVSLTALFDPEVRIPKGNVTVREIAALYPYDNELLALEGTGKMLKDALENAARYYSKPGLPGYNYDMASGVEYEVDANRPEGDRIRNLRWRGAALTPEQKLRIAVNSYRAGGSGGYKMFVGAKVLWRSQEGLRELIIRYYTERKKLPAEAKGNWRVVR
jgi:2',3'-cyclic-nucleotide 2'-phosphodiesterase / 3'-nucleotidase